MLPIHGITNYQTTSMTEDKKYIVYQSVILRQSSNNSGAVINNIIEIETVVWGVMAQSEAEAIGKFTIQLDKQSSKFQSKIEPIKCIEEILVPTIK